MQFAMRFRKISKDLSVAMSLAAQLVADDNKDMAQVPNGDNFNNSCLQTNKWQKSYEQDDQAIAWSQQTL